MEKRTRAHISALCAVEKAVENVDTFPPECTGVILSTRAAVGKVWIVWKNRAHGWRLLMFSVMSLMVWDRALSRSSFSVT